MRKIYYVIDNISFSSDAKRIAFASEWVQEDTTNENIAGHQIIYVWDIEQIKILASIRIDFICDSISFSPNGRFLLVSGTGTNAAAIIKLFDISSGKVKISIRDGESQGCAEINPAVFALSGSLIVSGSADKKVWSATTGKKLRTFKCETDGDYTCPVDVSPSGKKLAIGYINGFVKIWDVSSGKLMMKFKAYESTTENVKFSPKGRTIVTYNGEPGDDPDNEMFKVWDMSSNSIITQYKAKCSNPYAFFTDGTSFVTFDYCCDVCDSEPHIQLCDLKTGDVLREFPTTYIPPKFKDESLEINLIPVSLTFTKNGNMLISETAGTLIFWETASGKEKYILEIIKGGEWIFYSPDGYFTISSGGENKIKLKLEGKVYPTKKYFNQFHRPELFYEAVKSGVQTATGFWLY